MDIIFSLLIRLIVWFSGFARFLSRLGLCQFEEWSPGKPVKVLLVGYNGARNTGADARVVALLRQLEEVTDPEKVSFTVMTLSTEHVNGYFSSRIRLLPFTTFFFFSLLKAASMHHVAVLCEGSTLTRTFADALTLFFCEAAGIMKRQQKPCIAYGSEVGPIDGWLARLCHDMCRDTYFIVRTDDSLKNLEALGLKGHVGTDTAWTFMDPDGERWAKEQLLNNGWDGVQPIVGVAVINPYCWPVRPSLWRWLKALTTRDFSCQYDKMYFFSDSKQRREDYQRYLSEMAMAVNRYQQERKAFVVILGMEKLDTETCERFAQLINGPYCIHTSMKRDVFQMTGLLRQLSILVTSRYHAAVLSMEQAIPIVAVSMDGRLDGIIRETQLDYDYLHHVGDERLGEHVIASLHLAIAQREEIAISIRQHVVVYKKKVEEMREYAISWLKEHFS